MRTRNLFSKLSVTLFIFFALSSSALFASLPTFEEEVLDQEDTILPSEGSNEQNELEVPSSFKEDEESVTKKEEEESKDEDPLPLSLNKGVETGSCAIGGDPLTNPSHSTGLLLTIGGMAFVRCYLTRTKSTSLFWS